MVCLLVTIRHGQTLVPPLTQVVVVSYTRPGVPSSPPSLRGPSGLVVYAHEGSQLTRVPTLRWVRHDRKLREVGLSVSVDVLPDFRHRPKHKGIFVWDFVTKIPPQGPLLVIPPPRYSSLSSVRSMGVPVVLGLGVPRKTPPHLPCVLCRESVGAVFLRHTNR